MRKRYEKFSKPFLGAQNVRIKKDNPKTMAHRILDILKEEMTTVLPEYYSKKKKGALDYLKSHGICAEVYESEHCGTMIRVIEREEN